MGTVTVLREEPLKVQVQTDPPVNVAIVRRRNTISIVTPGVQGPPGANNADLYTGPQFSYNGDGTLDTIEYDDGSVKQFTYVAGRLERIMFTKASGGTVQKDFIYNLDGSLARIDQTNL